MDLDCEETPGRRSSHDKSRGRSDSGRRSSSSRRGGLVNSDEDDAEKRGASPDERRRSMRNRSRGGSRSRSRDRRGDRRDRDRRAASGSAHKKTAITGGFTPPPIKAKTPEHLSKLMAVTSRNQEIKRDAEVWNTGYYIREYVKAIIKRDWQAPPSLTKC